jgi:hypothetical protein
VSVTVDVGLAQMFRAGILMGLVVVVHVGIVADGKVMYPQTGELEQGPSSHGPGPFAGVS